MIGVGDDFTSSITDLSRFSNSPLMPAPACSKPRSKVRTATFSSAGGTSPAAIRRAKPSTTAVLPTPASPVRIGLFCRRRVRMSMICRISGSRPSTGSMSARRARAVKSIVYWSNAGVLVGPEGRPGAGVAVPATASAAAAWPLSSVLATTAGRSLVNASAEILCSSPEASRATRPSISSFNKAHSTCPERTCGAPNSTEAITQASRIKSTTWGDKPGGRALPVFNRSMAAVMARITREASISKCRSSAARSVLGVSSSLSSQCSISTL
jgi:hypothetical protein